MHAYKHPRDFLSPDIGYVHTASNEATKSTFLLFNGLLMTVIYKSYSGWEEGTSAKNPPASLAQNVTFSFNTFGKLL